MRQINLLTPVSTGAERLPAHASGIEVPAYGAEQRSEPETSGLLDYWRILRRRQGTLILSTFLGLVAGLLISLPQTPVFQARTSIEIQDLNDNFLNIKQISPVSESSGSATTLTDIQTQIKILQSDTLADRVLDKLKVSTKETPAADSDRLAAWRKVLNLGAPEQTGEQGRALAMAWRTLKVRAAGQTRIIEIRADSIDPKLAALYVNTLTNEFIEQNMEARWMMTERTGNWLNKQLEDMKIKLEHSEDALQSYARQSGLLFTSDKNSLAEEKLRQLQEELSKAQGDRVAKQSHYEEATKSGEVNQDVLSEALRDYQVKLTDLKRQRSELVTVYTASHSKVRRVEAEIETLEAALQRERQAILRRMKNEFDEAVRHEKLLQTDYAAQTRLVSDQSEKSIQYNILKREVESNRQLYDAMLQKMKEASVASALRASNIRIVDAAKPPRRPYKPNILINGTFGLLSGILLGISFVIMRERANRALREPGDALFYLNVPELGVIPAGNDARTRPLPYLSRKALEAAPGSTDAGERLEMVTWNRKPSLIAESFRAVLTSIFFSNQSGERPRVLMLTSPGPREGKTTVLCNLGIALAEVKKRTLLIDADMRRPRLHDVFEVPNEAGLSTLLQDETLLTNQILNLIHSTNIPNLSVLPSGPPTSSAANILHSDSMRIVLDNLSKCFDMILVDTPPMLQIPDARVVGRLVDGVILILRSGHTTRDAALAARQRFADDNTSVMGVILNDWNPVSSPNGYYGYFNGYYYKTHDYYKSEEEVVGLTS